MRETRWSQPATPFHSSHDPIWEYLPEKQPTSTQNSNYGQLICDRRIAMHRMWMKRMWGHSEDGFKRKSSCPNFQMIKWHHWDSWRLRMQGSRILRANEVAYLVPHSDGLNSPISGQLGICPSASTERHVLVCVVVIIQMEVFTSEVRALAREGSNLTGSVCSCNCNLANPNFLTLDQSSGSSSALSRTYCNV